MKKVPVNAVCFDMWGTLMTGGGMRLWEELRDIFGKQNMAIRDFITLGEHSTMVRPDSLREGVSSFASSLGVRDKSRIKKAFDLWWSYVLTAYPQPDTVGALQKIHRLGIPLYIVSNTDSSSFNFVMNKYELKKYFKAFFLSPSIGRLKPDLLIFQTAQDYLQLPKNQIMMIDDSLSHGVIPARNFGWRALWISRGRPGADPGKIENLDEVVRNLI